MWNEDDRIAGVVPGNGWTLDGERVIAFVIPERTQAYAITADDVVDGDELWHPDEDPEVARQRRELREWGRRVADCLDGASEGAT